MLPRVALEDYQPNLGKLPVVSAELLYPLMELEVISSSGEEGGRVEPRLQVNLEN